VKAEFAGVTLAWSAFSHVGNVRALNEDSLLAAAPVFVVADGMGGHESGEVASRLVVENFALIAQDGVPAIEDVVDTLHAINGEIRAAGDRADARSMGTTAVALILSATDAGLSWLVVNIGDSRAYVLKSGDLEQISVDHSYVQELVDSGQLTSEEARSHVDRNVITRALGVSELAQADYWVRAVVPNERYLLCSDGLTGEVEDQLIEEVLLAETSPENAAHRLGELALGQGGHDNVTVVVIDVLSVKSEHEVTIETRPGNDNLKSATNASRGEDVDRTTTVLIDEIPIWTSSNSIDSAVGEGSRQRSEQLISSVPTAGLFPEGDLDDESGTRSSPVEKSAQSLIATVPMQTETEETSP